MARKTFVILYPDGSKKNISATERNSLILSETIRHRDGVVYEFIGQMRTYHSFAALSDLKQRPPASYLAGSFIVVDTKGRKFAEMLETPAGLAVRLPRMIAQMEKNAAQG